MSVPFTNSTGAKWQTLLDEITLAYSERRQALGGKTHEYIAEAGRNIQSAAYWATIQAWVDYTCLLFFDHVNGPLNGTQSRCYFNISTFRAAAGLHPDGFRRATSWPNYNAWMYGYMQPGDIIGPWIFEDLQKSFGAMKWPSSAIDAGFSEGETGLFVNGWPFGSYAIWEDNENLVYYRTISGSTVKIGFRKFGGIDGTVDIFLAKYNPPGVPQFFLYQTLGSMDGTSITIDITPMFAPDIEDKLFAVIVVRKFNFTNA